jgi:hypothetical protein
VGSDATNKLTMTVDEFRISLKQNAPPSGLSLALQGLWHDGKGDWNAAHTCAQEQDDTQGAWVHAYLHRKEGDNINAGYWYQRAGKPFSKAPLEIEWETIVMSLL